MGDAQRTNNAVQRRGATNASVERCGATNTVVQPCGALNPVLSPCDSADTGEQVFATTSRATPRLGAIVLCGGHSRRFGKPKEWLTIDGETLLGRTVRVLRGCVDETVLAARSGQSLPPVDGVGQPISAVSLADQCPPVVDAVDQPIAIVSAPNRFPPAVIGADQSHSAADGADQSLPAARRMNQSLPAMDGAVERVNDELPDAGPIAGIVAGMGHLAARCPVIFVTACDHPRLDPQFVDCVLRQLDASDAGLIPSYRGQLFPLTAVYRSSMFIHFRDALAAGERSVQRVATRAGARVLVVDDHPSFRQEFVQQSLLNVNDPATWASIG